MYMTDNQAGNDGLASGASRPSGRGWRIAAWLLLGILLGVILAVAFFAYGQPELLLEQMNLRYCG